MIDPFNPAHLHRLSEAVDYSRWQLEPFRNNRMMALKQYVGFHYSASGADDRVPVNFLQLAVNIYLRQLVSRAPRAMESCHNPECKPVAADMVAWMDKATVGMRLGETLRLVVLNALFCVGQVKIAQAAVGEVEIGGTTQKVGQPFVEAVDLDDGVWDMTARRPDQFRFIGNRWRLPLEEAKNDPSFDPQERMKLTAQNKFFFNERGDRRTVSLSMSNRHDADEVEDYTELWDLYLPRERLVVTIPYSDSVGGGAVGQKPLKVVKWTGPQQGPYLLLSYADVPNNTMPVAPVQTWLDLHDLANRMWRKLGQQAERQKTILGVIGAATMDGKRIIDAKDGEAIRIDHPDGAREFRFGGIDGPQLMGAMQVKDLFVYLAGNLDSLGGLSAQAGTLGQDEMLHQSSAAQVAEMQDRTVSFTQEVYTHLGEHWWKNPVLSYKASREVSGIDLPVSITPQMRQIPFEDLGITIDPYSMQHSTPQTKVSTLMQLLQQLILPASGQLEEQGLKLKWPALFELIGKYGNLPELADILEQGPPPEMAGAMGMAQQALAGADKPPMPPVTTRNNVRINRPGATSRGQSEVMQQLLAGGGQPSQAAAVGRPVG